MTRLNLLAALEALVIQLVCTFFDLIMLLVLSKGVALSLADMLSSDEPLRVTNAHWQK